MPSVLGLFGVHVQAENFHRDALKQRRKAGASGPDDLAPFCYNLALVLGTNARKGPIENLEKGQREVRAVSPPPSYKYLHANSYDPCVCAPPL